MNKFTITIIALLVTNISFGQTLTELYNTVSPSVVKILVKSEENIGHGDPYETVVSGGLGTGVLVSKSGDIITAAHVVSSASEIEIVYLDGSTSSATIENISNAGDVAILKANRVPENATIAKFGDSDKVKVGDNIFIIGFPMGLEYSLSSGIISGIHHDKSKIDEGVSMEFFQTDAAINTGNSGGPMFNKKGEVVGIISSILSRSGGFEGVGFASTSNLVNNLLYKNGRFWFGVDGHFVNGTLAEVLNIPQDAALMISSVTPNSPAYFLGLRGGYLKTTIGKDDFLLGGDIILSIEKTPLDNIENISNIWGLLKNKKKGDKISFSILRSGSIKEYEWKVK
ncbi:MAG: trypsin-like peptidase domain-containing protein [Flavobacteriales bacterium]|nr:trypsin-like peptidase domain-containing protein [Flavobacteriales bacterium]